jgi:hypothetical protein
MCRWGSSVSVLVRIPADLSATGKSRSALIEVDACIAPIVKALNEAGVETIGSCCGHGKTDGSILLADGRELIIKARKG